jgi:hypothetical protein
MKLGSDLLLALSIFALALSWGCVNSNPAPASAAAGQKFFAVQVDSSAFYYYGPRQGSSPDKMLPKDTILTMIRHSFGYSKVRLSTGEKGYVASDDLHRASPALIAAVNAPPARSVTAAHLAPNPEDSSFTMPEPAPDFEPTPIPLPANLSN